MSPNLTSYERRGDKKQRLCFLKLFNTISTATYYAFCLLLILNRNSISRQRNC